VTNKRFHQEDELVRGVLEIIAHYQPIPTMDIWYELGEDDRFDKGITRSEVTEVLSKLEKQNIIVKETDDKWKVTCFL
jgi:DNA-binding MarR family transcriptional regulator